MDKPYPLISLTSAYHDFCSCILTLPEELLVSSMDGWSPRDVVAHLIGWNRHMIAAAGAILAGEGPSYYADAPNDYKNINAGFVARHASRSKADLLRQLESSMDEFEHYILTLPPAELEASHGVMHYSGHPATVAGIIASLAGDYQHHTHQVSEWYLNRGVLSQ